eukprot:560833-Pleurochrysis_carterae.AAC.1
MALTAVPVLAAIKGHHKKDKRASPLRLYLDSRASLAELKRRAARRKSCRTGNGAPRVPVISIMTRKTQEALATEIRAGQDHYRR